MGSNHDIFIRDALASDDSIWKICSWHKNQRLMQVGNQQDEVGWGPYEECREGGAIVATGHEHSYARTHLMDNFETQSIVSTSSTLQIEKGKSFAFVSGLGGKSTRVQNDALAANPWWAAVYTATQGANSGALFCIFSENGVRDRAHCYFKDIDGIIADEFDLQAPAPASIVVSIDIKPGGNPDSINPKSNGIIPLALLTGEEFDATTVDADSVRFGPAGAEKVHKQAHIEDVDQDGDLDLLLHFRWKDTGITEGDTEACITGQTTGGTYIEGCAAIRPVGE